MLKETFFEISRVTLLENTPDQQVDSASYQVEISLNPEHEIYQGHFPGNPIVPGACQVRIITEILSEIEQREVQLKEADNIKFLAMINPHEHSALVVKLILKRPDDDFIHVTASISDGDQLFFKYKSKVQ